MKAVIVIPARLDSKRLPRKLLLAETGKPLIQHTWEQACKTGLDVEIVTDSRKIMSACAQAGFGASCSLSIGEYRSGTERIASFVQDLDEYDVIVNWQADEPLIDPYCVTELVTTVEKGSTSIWTLFGPIEALEAQNRHRTKVVMTRDRKALYFSRARIPSAEIPGRAGYQQHIGLYVYQSGILQKLVRAPFCELERHEELEQLRWLYEGYTIRLEQHFGFVPLSINTREDYDVFVKRQKQIDTYECEHVIRR